MNPKLAPYHVRLAQEMYSGAKCKGNGGNPTHIYSVHFAELVQCRSLAIWGVVRGCVMAKRLAGVFITVLMLAVATMGSATNVAAADYTCPYKACSFTVPDFYNKLDSDDMSYISFKDSNSGGIFLVLVQAAPARATLDDLAQALLQDQSTEKGFRQVGSISRTTLDTVPARDFTFRAVNSRGISYAQTIYVAVYQGQEYVLQFTTTLDAVDDFVASAGGILDSWQFT